MGFLDRIVPFGHYVYSRRYILHYVVYTTLFLAIVFFFARWKWYSDPTASFSPRDDIDEDDVYVEDIVRGLGCCLESDIMMTRVK